MPTARQRAQLARDGIFNLRDLGGIPATDGRVVARRRIVRADALHRTRSAVHVLHDLGVVRVLDLRADDEREHAGVFSAEGVEVLHHPVVDPAFAWYDDVARNDPAVLALRYREILRTSGKRFADAVAAIAEVLDGDAGSVAYHCAVGKDRTGLLTALLLDGLGVHHDAIAHDYAKSAAATAVQVSWLWSFGHPYGAATDDDLFVGVWSARPETMAATLDFLGEEFGGATGYLADHGVDAEQIEVLRVKLLVDSEEATC